MKTLKILNVDSLSKSYRNDVRVLKEVLLEIDVLQQRGEVLLATGERQFEILLPDPERRGVILPLGETRRSGRERLAAPTALGRRLETHAAVDEDATLGEGHLGEAAFITPHYCLEYDRPVVGKAA